MFGEIVHTPNLALLAAGVAPETSTEEDWRAAAMLVEQRDSGILRGYYKQTHIAALRPGEVAVTMAWSGDIFAAKLLGKIPDRIRFVVPAEGALLWTDNMCIPKGAAHLSDAITDTSNLHTYRELRTEEEIRVWHEIFRPIYQVA
jgi:spermidine/putrescine transport system substrate-binding protein